jgi:tetracycline repressor-like protein
LYESLVPSEKLDSDCGSLEADMQYLLRTVFKIYRETKISRALAGLAAELPRSEKFATRMRTSFLLDRRQILSRFLQKAQRRGEIRDDIDLNLISDMITGSIWFRVLMEHEELNDEFAEKLTAQFLKGITP